MLLSAVGLMTFTACADDKYDLSDIDTTIGVGSDDGLTLPTSSTKEIFLDDLLELDNSDIVVIKENGDYVFQQKGDSIDPVHPMIDKVFISEGTTTNIPVKIEVPTLPNGFELLPVGTPLPGTASTLHKEIQTFDYEDDCPAEIESLISADADGSIDVTITFTEDLNGFISTFKTFNVDFPQYMEIDVLNASQAYTLEGDILKFTDVPTSKDLTIKIHVKKLYFNEIDENNKLKLENGKIVMIGDVKVDVTYDDAVKGSGDINNLLINSTMSINNLTITGATGKFSPKIEIAELGGVTLDDLPDFLTDGDVVVDLYNPQIQINVESDLSVPGILSGTLIAKDENDNEIKRVAIPDMKINAVDDNGGISNILICRRNENVPAGITDVVVVPGLSDILRKIPHTISFETTAHADDSKDSHIDLGHEYTIKTSYSIEAPIAFGEDARIVYKDTIDGLNDDLKDLELTKDTQLSITADIENRIPAYLTMSAHAINAEGNRINDLTVEVNKVIEAAEDSNVPTTTKDLTITIKQAGGDLSKVDGIVFSIGAAASDGNKAIVGQTLNAQKHSLKVTNMKIQLKGRVIIKSED